MDAFASLVNEVVAELLAKGKTTPQSVTAEMILQHPIEVDAKATELVREAIARRASAALRESVQRVLSPQLAFLMPGYGLPKAIPSETPDGIAWVSSRDSQAEDWESWFRERETQIEQDTQSVDTDRRFYRFTSQYGFVPGSGITLAEALARAGVAI